MTKRQAIAILGTPDSTKGGSRNQVLVYRLMDNWTGRMEEYWIELLNGRVTTYGRPQDFGRMQPAPLNVNVTSHSY